MARTSKSRMERYPIGRLFAIATMRIEDAHEIATRGQSGALTRRQQRAIARRLMLALDRCKSASEDVMAALDAQPPTHDETAKPLD